MTRKSKREVERGINDLRGRDRDPGGPGIIIGYEREDGTLTDPNGEPLPEDADPVLIIPWHVARTWS